MAAATSPTLSTLPFSHAKRSRFIKRFVKQNTSTYRGVVLEEKTDTTGRSTIDHMTTKIGYFLCNLRLFSADTPRPPKIIYFRWFSFVPPKKWITFGGLFHAAENRPPKNIWAYFRRSEITNFWAKIWKKCKININFNNNIIIVLWQQHKFSQIHHSPSKCLISPLQSTTNSQFRHKYIKILRIDQIHYKSQIITYRGRLSCDLPPEAKKLLAKSSIWFEVWKKEEYINNYKC
jgi:hypothetical protein